MRHKITINTYQTGRKDINILPVKLGYFAIQNEVNNTFIIPLKALNFDIVFGKQPEISVGKVFSNYLLKNHILIDGDVEHIEQQVNNYRRTKTKIYSNRLLEIFREFFFNVWLPYYGIKYYPDTDKLIKVLLGGDTLAS